METSLSINAKINNILKKDDELVKVTKGAIYPLVAKQDTNFPLVVFYRTTVTPTYSKCGRVMDTTDFTVEVGAKSYKQSVEIAEMVRHDLELHHDSYFANITLVGCDEEYSYDTYVQRLNFEAKIF